MLPWIAEFCSDVRPAAVEWLWPGYLARGKLSLLDGDPEMGKSLLAIDLIARLSRGTPMPDGAPGGPPSTSILLSAEDDPADTIRPRAEAAGVDLNRMVIPRFDDRVPRLPEDLPALEQLVRDCEAGLVVIDPLMAFLPRAVAANVDQCVRLALGPLSVLAARTGCAVQVIRHLGKRFRDRAILRGQGSMGIVAAARTALFVARYPGEPATDPLGVPAPTGPGTPDRVLAVAKTNVGRRPPSLGYRVVASPSGLPVIEWTGRVEMTADELCRGRPPEGLKVRERAVDWLRRELAAGPRKAGDLYAAAAAAGIPDRTLERAKERLRAESHRDYDWKAKRGEWWWYDPAAPWPKKAPFEKPRDRFEDMPDLPWFRGN
ncbi:MAG: AAA family ATPase [Zavarzinella sp.]|nr:AAA family ATPase [Zavarzinella sp.]